MTMLMIPRLVWVDSRQSQLEAGKADVVVLWRCWWNNKDLSGDEVEEDGTQGLGDSK